MTIVQLAIPRWNHADAVTSALARDGEYEVRIVDQLDPTSSGLLVISDGQLDQLRRFSPENVVVIATRNSPELLLRLWQAGIRNVVFAGDPPLTIYLAIVAAHTRLRARRGETVNCPILAEGVTRLQDNGLRGPFALSDSTIDREVTEKLPGTFLLDDSDDGLTFRVAYVGRSDWDVNNQLHVHVGIYKRFKFEYCPSPREAFEKHCILFHDFEPHDNPAHPSRPAGSDWKCPRCGLFG